jgi:hypothetical protein
MANLILFLTFAAPILLQVRNAFRKPAKAKARR